MFEWCDMCPLWREWELLCITSCSTFIYISRWHCLRISLDLRRLQWHSFFDTLWSPGGIIHCVIQIASCVSDSREWTTLPSTPQQGQEHGVFLRTAFSFSPSSYSPRRWSFSLQQLSLQRETPIALYDWSSWAYCCPVWFRQFQVLSTTYLALQEEWPQLDWALTKCV